MESAVAPGIENWQGTLRFDDQRDAWELVTAGRGDVRLPNGWIGDFTKVQWEGYNATIVHVIGFGRLPV